MIYSNATHQRVVSNSTQGQGKPLDNQCCASDRSPEGALIDELNQVHNKINGIENRLTDLRVLLTPVWNQEPQNPNSVGGPNQPSCRPPVYESLEDIKNKLDCLFSRVEEILRCAKV